MTVVHINRSDFLGDRQGRTFTDVLNDAGQPFDILLQYFDDEGRQQRMEDSETHHDRPALAGVIRELESLPEIDAFLSEVHLQRSKRLRQATGVLVRMIMERRGWKKTGKKGSLGVRAKSDQTRPSHNTGGLAFWFIRAERYERQDGMPFQTVRQRRQRYKPAQSTTQPSRRHDAAQNTSAVARRH